MNVGTALNAVSFVFYAFLNPLIWLISWLLSLLYLLVSPVLYLAHGLLGLALFPLRILLKFESFLYFLTGAVLTGALVGLMLHFIGDALAQFLQPHTSKASEERNDHKLPKEQLLDWESQWTDWLPSSTIVEEEEDSQTSN